MNYNKAHAAVYALSHYEIMAAYERQDERESRAARTSKEERKLTRETKNYKRGQSRRKRIEP